MSISGPVAPRRAKAPGRRTSDTTDPPDSLAEAIAAREPRNFLIIAVYQIVLRVGWVFKTESVIVPAFLDMIAGAGWLRGLLPLVNRFGQSVPPMLFSRRLRAMRRKRSAMAVTTASMGAVFLTLAAVWWAIGGRPAAWLPACYLGLYAVFACCHGMNQLSLDTVQGKLVRPARRGRLLAVAFAVGGVASIASAWMLLGRWLAAPQQGFTLIFAFTGTCFVLCGLGALAINEPADGVAPADDGMARYLADSWNTIRQDEPFRRLLPVVLLLSTTLMLFPHYQALGRVRLGLGGVHLMYWVVLQNLAVSVASSLIGPLADRRGTRLALRLLLFGVTLTPVVAVALAYQDPDVGRHFYWLVFLPLGLTPVTLKILVNYTLEISDRQEHPRYLSALGVCLAAPFCLSPLLGWLIDATSFALVFLSVAGLLLLGALLTFRLVEPRHHELSAASMLPSPSEE